MNRSDVRHARKTEAAQRIACVLNRAATGGLSVTMQDWPECMVTVDQDMTVVCREGVWVVE